MKTRKRKGKRKRQSRDPDKLCTWVDTDGVRCNAYKQKGREYCSCHPPGQSSELGKKGAAVTNNRWAQIEAACERLPLLTPDNQAKYLNALIEEEDSKGKSKRIPVIVSLQRELRRVTKDKDEETGLDFTFSDPELPVDPVEDLPPIPMSSCPNCGEAHNGEPKAPDGDPEA